MPTVKTPPARRRRKPTPPPPPPPERLVLTVPETAALLGCSEVTVWRLLSRGRLKRVRIGTSTRINRAAVEAYAATGDGAKK